MKTFDLLWGNVKCHHGSFEGAEHFSRVEDMQKRHGVWFVKCGTPSCIVPTTWGTSGTGNTAHCWGLHSLSRAVSCAALKHCLHILMLILGRQEQMWTIWFCSCPLVKELCAPLSLFLFFCSSVCHKKQFLTQIIFFGGLTQAENSSDNAESFYIKVWC